MSSGGIPGEGSHRKQLCIGRVVFGSRTILKEIAAGHHRLSIAGDSDGIHVLIVGFRRALPLWCEAVLRFRGLLWHLALSFFNFHAYAFEGIGLRPVLVNVGAA